MSRTQRATARACSNIALIKYWGKRDASLNIPLNDSLSMTLSAAVTTTTVEWDEDLSQDELYLDGERVLDGRALRVSRYLDRIREAYYRCSARVVSQNSFPAGTGIASSASGFAALAAAAIAAFGEGLPDERELSRWARRGSGSACRSVSGGFVEWCGGTGDANSFGKPFCPAEHWDLRDMVVVVSRAPKLISSSQGHEIAAAHPFMEARQALLPGRMLAAKGAVVGRDFSTLGTLVEHEALEVQGIMMSGQPAALYMQPETVALLHRIRMWRAEGLPVYFTLDAGPNVHVLCRGEDSAEVGHLLSEAAPGAEILENRPGPPVCVLEDHLI